MAELLSRPTAWTKQHPATSGLIVLLLLVFLLYYPGASGPFMLDDFTNLTNNNELHVKELSVGALIDAAFSSHAGTLRRPVAMLSFALNHYLGGTMTALPIKLTNIVLHLFTTVLVFYLTSHLLTRLYKLKTGTHATAVAVRQQVEWGALFITALWALHPLHVSTVLYAVQRMTVLAGLFTVAGALFYVRGRERLIANQLWSGVRNIVLGISGCGLLATLSKENGALLPVLVLVIEAVFYRFAVGPVVPRAPRLGLVALLALPSLAIAAYLLYVLVGPAGSNPIRDFTAGERLLTQTRILFFYINQLLIPNQEHMSLFHGGIEVSRGLLAPPVTLLATLGLVALLGAAVYCVCRARALPFAFAVLWFLGGHLLESTVIPLELVFEHRNYLPSYGLVFALGYALTQGPLSRWLRPTVRYAFYSAVLLALASPLQLRASYWSNISDFLVYELVNHPHSPRAWVSLAYAEAQRGLYDDAAKFYRKAGELEPMEAGHLVGALSLEVHELKRPPDEVLLAQILTRLAHNPVTFYGAGQLYRMGSSFKGGYPPDSAELAAVVRIFQQATSNDRWPTVEHRAAAYFLLAELQVYQHKLFEAEQMVRRGLQFQPDAARVRLELAELLLHLKRPQDARRELALVDATVLSNAERTRLEALRVQLSPERSDLSR